MAYQTPHLRVYGSVAEVTACFAPSFKLQDTIFNGDGTVLGEGSGDNDCTTKHYDFLSADEVVVPCYPEGVPGRTCP